MNRKLIKFFLGTLFFYNAFAFAQDKTASCYIIQQLSPYINAPYASYTNSFNIMTEGEYYVADKEDILNFIKKKYVDFSKLTMIVDIRMYPPLNTFISSWDSIEGGLCISDLHSRIREIFKLQDSEIYKIGERYYVLRKVKYAYIDTLQVFGEWGNVGGYIYGDNIPKAPNEKDRWSVNEILRREKYQIFYYLMELLPTDKEILSHLWKRKYELDIEGYREWEQQHKSTTNKQINK